MTDPIERELKAVLDDRSRGDPLTVQTLAESIATLPARRSWSSARFSPLAAAAAIVVIVVAAIAAPRLGGIGGKPSPTPSALQSMAPGQVLPGGPEAFAGDPRLAQCGFGSMEFVFVMEHARDYRQYLPSMGLSPELDADASALAVVFSQDMPQPPTTGFGPGATNEPEHRYVCVVLDSGDPNLYSDVDITGLTVNVTPSEPSASSTPPASSPELPVATPTPPPAPVWVADLAGQLDCDGTIANIGGEVPEGSSTGTLGPTPDAALTAFLGPSNPYASLPATGFTQIHNDEHWASYAHVYEGRIKAIIVLSDLTDHGSGWLVVGLRACDPSEFDPAVPLTFPVTVWTDAGGSRLSTETILSAPGPGHCGWDSAIWLQVGGNLYFRDPDGVMSEWTTTTFASKAHLPEGAADTGYRTGVWSLWLDPGGDAYLVLSDTIERWPQSTDPFLGCS